MWGKGVICTALIIAMLLHTSCTWRPWVTGSVSPSSSYFQEFCPDLQYEVVAEFSQKWRGKGFFGFPFNNPPDYSELIEQKIHEHNGDAVIDVKVDYDFRLIYAVLWTNFYPRSKITGKVIRYINGSCTNDTFR
jgi:hypothetical protein